MKFKPIIISLVLATSFALVLSGCAQGKLEMKAAESDSGVQGFVVIAENAGKNQTSTASLEVAEGQCITVSPLLEKGALHVTLTAESTNVTAIDADFDGKILSYHVATPGNYKLEVSGSASAAASGEMSIWISNIDDILAIDASLAQALREAGVEVDPAFAGMANPWTDGLENAAAAAQTAGITDFGAPAGNEIDLGGDPVVTYRAMSGLAEANYEYPAAKLTVRKGTASVATEGDISGDYGEYAKTWTTTINGHEATCFGNKEGEATKTIWKGDNDMYFSIVAQGLGGDTDFGLNAERLAAFTANIG